MLLISQFGPVPRDEPARSDWIVENYPQIKRLQNRILFIPNQFPKSARRNVDKAIASSIIPGMSYKVVLATLGLPHEVAEQSGGSGPVELPSSYWSYKLENSEEILKIEFRINDNLDDAIVKASAFNRPARR